MARSSQTFRKRQRENKLREKAQLKRERREQRKTEKKMAQVAGAEPIEDGSIRVEDEPGEETELEVERNN